MAGDAKESFAPEVGFETAIDKNLSAADFSGRRLERGTEKASTVGNQVASLSAPYSCSSLMWPMPPSTVRRKVFGDLP